MLIRTLAYSWMCDKCKGEKKVSFDVRSFEEYPILNDPPEGWIKIGTPYSPEHWCPDCINKLVSLNIGVGKVIWDESI